MTDTVEPVVARTALSAAHRQLQVDGGAALLNWVPSGFAVTDGGGLNADIAAGRAFLDGTIADRDVATTGQTLAASSTNHVFVYIDDILDDGVVYFRINTTGTAPTEGPSHKLAEVTTDGSSVTGVTDFRRLVAELAGGLVLGGPLTAATVQSPAASALTLLGGTGTVIVSSLLRPEADGTRDLGILAQRFRDVRLSRTLFIGDAAQLQQLTAGRLDLLTGVDFNIVLGDIILAADRLVDGVDVSDHSARHDAGGSDAMAIDAAVGVGSLRTIGSGAAQAAQGSAFADHDARHEPGGADPMAVDAPAATGSLRSIGGGALQAKAGDAAPLAHDTSHEPGGGDPMAVDAAVSVGSLRTIGGGGQQAAPGDHAHKFPGTRDQFVLRSTVGTSSINPSSGFTAFEVLWMEFIVTGDAAGRARIIFDDDTTFDMSSSTETVPYNTIIDRLGNRTRYIKRIDLELTFRISGSLSLKILAWQF